MSQQLQQIIDTAWENRAELSPKAAPADVREAVAHAIEQLDKGALRVAEKKDGDWVVNQWLKKAVLLSFRLEDNAPMPAGGYSQFYDKVPSKFANYTAEDFAAGGFRVVNQPSHEYARQAGEAKLDLGQVWFRFGMVVLAHLFGMERPRVRRRRGVRPINRSS